MPIPKTFSKVTSHRVPRYMLYQPGFNRDNSCWIEGEWITVPEKEWKSRHKQHEKMYANVWDEEKKQHHRDKGTTIKNLSPAQRQAWEFFSGTETLDTLLDDSYSCIRVDIKADRYLTEKSLKWVRKKGYKIIHYVKAYDRKRNQLKGHKFPKDIIHENPESEPIDTVAMTIKQNTDMFNAVAETGLDDGSPFGLMMAVQRIIQLEEEIIRIEYNKQQGKEDPYEDVRDSIETYRRLRKKAEESLADFPEDYENSRRVHNECARNNLDNSKGFLACYVLPKFNPDGTHEPWGEKDVPWGRKD